MRMRCICASFRMRCHNSLDKHDLLGDIRQEKLMRYIVMRDGADDVEYQKETKRR